MAISMLTRTLSALSPKNNKIHSGTARCNADNTTNFVVYFESDLLQHGELLIECSAIEHGRFGDVVVGAWLLGMPSEHT